MVVIWMLCFIMVMDGLAVLARECVSGRDELKRVHRSGPSDGTQFSREPLAFDSPGVCMAPAPGCRGGRPAKRPTRGKQAQTVEKPRDHNEQ